MSLLEVRDLHVWFDLPDGGQLHAVQGVSFDVDAGERIGLVGESGCGKTTTILAILGLLPPSATVAGEVRFDGDEHPGRRRGDRRSPYRWKRHRDGLPGSHERAEPGEDHRGADRRADGSCTGPPRARRPGGARASSWRWSGSRPRAGSRYPHEFSGGMRQRAALAMALACEPKVLLADEPTTALDVMVQAQILELLTGLAAELGLALVLVTHDLPVVAQVCERAAVMYAGEIVETGGIEDLFHTPAPSVHAAAVRGDARPVRARTMSSRSRERRRAWTGRSSDARSGRDATARSTAARVERPMLLPLEAGRAAACHLNDEPGRAGSRWPMSDVVRLAAGETSAGRARRGAVAGGAGPVHPLPCPARASSARSDARPRRSVRAVDGVSLSLHRGEMLALVGESGCGKTTTAQTILRLVDPVSGTIDAERARHHASVAARAPARPPDDADDPPGPVRVAGPAVPRAPGDRGADADPPRRRRSRASGRTGRGRARPRRADAAGDVRRSLPARALGRAAAAGRDRREPGARTRPAHRRRARFDARRVGARRRPSPARRPAARQQAGRADDHARSVDGRALRRSDRRDVPGPDRRGGVRRATSSTTPSIRTRRRCCRSFPSATRAIAPSRRSSAGEPPNPIDVPPGCRFHPRCPVAEDRCR